MEELERSLNFYEMQLEAIDIKVVDGSQLCQKMDPNKLKHLEITNIHEYTVKLLAPEIEKLLMSCNALHLIFYVYVPNSLKSSIREKRAENLQGV